MSEITENENQKEEVSLQDIDRLLDAEDPEFREDLKQVAVVQAEGELDEDSAIGEIAEDFEEEEPTEEGGGSALTRAKDFLGFTLSRIKGGLKTFGGVFGHFKALSRRQKTMIFAVLLLSVGVILLTVKNLKGVWIPTLEEPVITSLSQVADTVHELESVTTKGERAESFFTAFPRSPDLFLFDKFKVNLKPGPDHPNPMGAFEVVLELDSHDSAVEMQERQVEFHDLIQRDFESQTYPSMLTESGKKTLKELIKSDLSQKLSQGWVEDVHFQTFILKP